MKDLSKLPTHILFSENPNDYQVVAISEAWHLLCNNFKGTLKECEAEGERQKAEYLKSKPIDYLGDPHYPGAPQGSIWDY